MLFVLHLFIVDDFLTADSFFSQKMQSVRVSRLHGAVVPIVAAADSENSLEWFLILLNYLLIKEMCPYSRYLKRNLILHCRLKILQIDKRHRHKVEP